MRIVIYYFMCRDKKKTPYGVVIYILLLAYLVERAIFVLCQLQLSYLFLAVGFIPPLRGFKILRQELFLFLLCSWMWVLYTPSGL